MSLRLFQFLPNTKNKSFKYTIMKQFITFLLLFVSVVAFCAQPGTMNIPEQKFDGLSGNVMSVKTFGFATRYDDRTDSYEKGNLLTIKVQTFDESGHLTSTVMLDGNNAVISTETREYLRGALNAIVVTDSTGVVVRSEKFVENRNGGTVWEITEKDETKRVLKSFSEDGILLVCTLDGRPIEGMAYDAQNRLVASFAAKGNDVVTDNTYSYDRKGNLVKIICKYYGEVSSLLTYRPMAYDESGNWTESLSRKNLEYYILSREITYR